MAIVFVNFRCYHFGIDLWVTLESGESQLNNILSCYAEV